MKKYRNTEAPSDIVTLETIIKRYFDINDTLDGIGEYIESGFRNDTGFVEYVPVND